MILIGISGKKGVGKDLLASFLKQKYGFVNIPFAHELKAAVRRDFGFTLDHTDGALKEQPTSFFREIISQESTDPRSEYWTPKEIMIAYGQFFRQFDRNYWVKKTFDRIQQIRMFQNYGADQRVSISDVRFRNEADHIKSQGGILVRLERKPELNIYKEESMDISETELDDYQGFDFVCPKQSNIVPKDLELFSDFLMNNILALKESN